jgi:hypothetical protein
MQSGILAAKVSVLLYLTRLDRFIQGFSVSYRNSMGFSRDRSSNLPVENPILLYFLNWPPTIHSAGKADGPA